MGTRYRDSLPLALAILLIAAIAAIKSVIGQSSDSYDLWWNSINAGGSIAAHSTSYRLNASTGQAMSSGAASTSDSYELVSGFFWTVKDDNSVFVPRVTR